MSVWLSGPGRIFHPIALDLQGMPIIDGDPFGAWLVTAPQNAVEIVDQSIRVDDASADAHGIWLLSYQKVYLWTPGATLRLVSSALSQSGPSSSLAGPCR